MNIIESAEAMEAQFVASMDAIRTPKPPQIEVLDEGSRVVIYPKTDEARQWWKDRCQGQNDLCGWTTDGGVAVKRRLGISLLACFKKEFQ